MTPDDQSGADLLPEADIPPEKSVPPSRARRKVGIIPHRVLVLYTIGNNTMVIIGVKQYFFYQST